MDQKSPLHFTDFFPPGIIEVLDHMPFFMYRNRDMTTTLLDKIAARIELMKPTDIMKIQTHLGLQFQKMSRNASGNVCFADDPNLRPDFRTSFHPFDLWDYYYAIWHDPGWWEARISRDEYLPLPASRPFWKIVSLGKELRNLHTTHHRQDFSHFTSSEPKEGFIEVRNIRFRMDMGSEATCRLYLNEHFYIDQVPREVREYAFPRYYPLETYLKSVAGKEIDTIQVQSICEWIGVITQTHRIGKAVHLILG